MELNCKLIENGIDENIIEFVNNPNDGAIACQIGEYWFYFIGLKDEYITPHKLRKQYTDEELAKMIYNAITELEDEEKDYYRYYLEEHLEKNKY